MILGWRAEAQAVPVDLLKTVVSADVSCDGAVDETAMLKAVQRWSTECNIELSTIGERPEEQIIRSLLDMDEMPLSALRNSDVKEEITGLVEPVLERWAFAKEELSASDKKVLAMLDSLCLIPDTAEGMAFLRLNYPSIYKRVHFSPEGRTFVDVLVSQPLCNEDLGGEEYVMLWSQIHMADWAVQLEKFLRSNAKNPYAPDAVKRYHAIINLMLFRKIPPRDQDGFMYDRWNWWKHEMMGFIVKKHQGTLTGHLIEEFIASVDANDQKEPKDMKQRLASRIDTEFT